MERLKFLALYLFMVAFFLYPSITMLFYDKSKITAIDFLLILFFLACGVGLVVMGVGRLIEIKRKRW
ncbi:hypothetical protein C5976_06015 [Cronobacter sakazakii]|nr:hypothetical protein C5958_16265 [Cronobacter sakazakii]PQZ45648.1 hypothetical protein C5976_06015 [Cronobacter sakazakii]PUX40791.1 hypothetical protein BS424_22585 [Cronobacter sakazakii]PUX69057.1 hypothetical protein BS420_05110 [Cronobacter sakazakii]